MLDDCDEGLLDEARLRALLDDDTRLLVLEATGEDIVELRTDEVGELLGDDSVELEVKSELELETVV